MSSSTVDELPWIFLSHSGQQKDFVTHLYYSLLHAKHRPFFDKDSKDSLRIGLHYPTRIFEACRTCKIGVVVLTEDYVSSLWPMLELQHLLQGPADRPIYPLFYRLRPAELSNPDNLKRWEEHWKQKAPAWQSRMQELQENMASSSNGSCRNIQINLDIASWPDNLKRLQYRSGEVCNAFHVNLERSFYESEYKYIQVIVDNISASLPPPMEYLLEAGVVGEKRMQQEINQVFQRESSMGDDGVRVIGVHGIGGSGKSTLCKMMANFYGDEFPGRCFFLELPTPGEGGKGNDDTMLLERIKAVLKSFGHGGTDRTSHIDQAMKYLERELLRGKAFLAIDNVWDVNLEYAQRSTRMKFVPGTKIMITSRSREIVDRLLLSRHEKKEVGDGQFPSTIHRNVVHVPSLGEAEAVQALKRQSPCASFIPEEDLRKLARSCFFEEQCHPLYLKLKGKELEQKGHPSFLPLQWSNLISNMIVPLINSTSEKVVSDAVEKSFDALPNPRLQDIFIDLVTFQSHEVYTQYGPFRRWRCSLLDFVRLHYDDYTEDEMFSAALELQYHGLLVLELERQLSIPMWEMWTRLPNWKVIIHDLHKVVANTRVHADALVKSPIQLERVRISSWGRTFNEAISRSKSKHVNIILASSRASPNLRAFSGSRQLFEFGRLHPVQVQARYLSIVSSSSSKVRFSIFNKPRLNLRNGSRNLEALRVLSLVRCWQIQEITGWRAAPNLAVLRLKHMTDLRRIESMGCLKKLETLDWSNCDDLDIHSLVGGGTGRSLFKVGDCLPRLQEITIDTSRNLTEGGPLSDAFPALTSLTLENCPKLRRVEGSCSSLKLLHLLNCNKLQRIPDVAGSLTTLIRAAFPVCKQSAHSSQSAHSNNKRINYESRGAAYSVLSLVTGSVFRSSAPHLRQLSLFCADPDVCRWHVSVDAMPSLEYLRLTGFESVQKLTFESAVVKLKSVHLENLVSLEEISGLGARHVELERIFIVDCPSLAVILDADSKNSLPALKHCTSFTDASGVSGLASLRELSVIRCTSLTSVSGVSGLASLTELDLRRCTSLTDVSGLSGLASLTRLDLSASTSLTDVSGLSGLASLTWLDLRACTSLTHVSGLSSLASLIRLDLRACTSLTDVSGLSGLASLTRLDLSACTSLTHVSGLSGLASLTDLDLSGCTSLTDVSGLSGLASLIELDLSGCTSLTDVSGLSGLASLTLLNLSGCTSLTDVSGVSGLTTLHELHMMGCTSH